MYRCSRGTFESIFFFPSNLPPLTRGDIFYIFFTLCFFLLLNATVLISLFNLFIFLNVLFFLIQKLPTWLPTPRYFFPNPGITIPPKFTLMKNGWDIRYVPSPLILKPFLLCHQLYPVPLSVRHPL